MLRSTKWLRKKRLELSFLQEEAKKMRQLAAYAADKAILSKLQVLKLNSAAQWKQKPREKRSLISQYDKIDKGYILVFYK